MLMGSLHPTVCCIHPPNLSPFCFIFRAKHGMNVKWILQVMSSSFIVVGGFLLNSSIQICCLQDLRIPLYLGYRVDHHLKICPEMQSILLLWKKKISMQCFSFQFFPPLSFPLSLCLCLFMSLKKIYRNAYVFAIL